MKEKIGEVFSVALENPPIHGCTVSREITGREQYVAYYSLAAGTDISAEIYAYHKLLLVHHGDLTVYGERLRAFCAEGDCIVTLTDTPVGMSTETGSVYTEIMIRRDDIMNQAIKAGEAFKFAELVPYQSGKIVNMDVVHNEKTKLVIMAFDAGTGLSEHAAPGEAIIFALDGEGVIGYEGVEHLLHAGESFVFAKGGRHFVRAEGRFKMALLLTL